MATADIPRDSFLESIYRKAEEVERLQKVYERAAEIKKKARESIRGSRLKGEGAGARGGDAEL